MNDSKKASIKNKLILSYLIITFASIAVYLGSFIFFRSLIIKYDKIVQNLTVANSIPIEFNNHLFKIENYILNIEDKEGQETNKTIELKIKQLSNDVQFLNRETDILNTQSINQLVGIKNMFSMIEVKVKNLLENKNHNKLEKSLEDYALLHKMSYYLQENISEYLTYELEYSSSYREEIKQKIDLLGILGLTTIILISLGGLYFGVKLATNLAKTLFNITNTKFNTNYTSIKDSSLEIDNLYKTFNNLNDDIKSYIDKLSSSEKRTVSILNGLIECVITTDSYGNLQSGNSAVENVFGYNLDELNLKNICDLIPQIDFSKGNISDLLSNDPMLKVVDGKYQLSGLSKKGKVFPVEVGISEVGVENAIISIFVIHDITQRNEFDRMKEEFISIVSHELRTPLTSIKGSLELAASDVLGKIPNQAKNMIEIACNNTYRLMALINDILDLERIQSGKIKFKIEPVDVITLIKEVIESNQPYAVEHKVKLEFKSDLTTAKVNADRDKLNQVITNLISNACKFSNDDEVVLLGVERRDTNIRIFVKDKGPGIPEEYREKIFKKFLQVDSVLTRQKGGTGLGLSICKQIMENINGKIDYQTELGTGSTFYVELAELVEGA